MLLLAVKINVPYRLKLGKHSLIKPGYFYFMLEGKPHVQGNQTVFKLENWTFILNLSFSNIWKVPQFPPFEKNGE